MSKTFDLELISEMLIESITDLFDFFGLSYQDGLSSISFECPIHSSDNPTGSSILKDGVGNWICYTGQCHEQYGTSNGASILQFLQALLNTQLGPHTFLQTIEWAAQFLGVEPTQQNFDYDRINFIKLCNYINRSPTEADYKLPRNSVKDFLSIPSSYYIKRGYTRDILEKFDIGYCHNKNKPFYDRIVAPFYDLSGQYMVGYSSRSRYEKCLKCGFCHDNNVRCPITTEEQKRCIKWKNSSTNRIGGYLYNLWNAKNIIEDSGIVILVEGPGDVWRFEEAGIHNSVAILKASISRDQIINLEMSGAIDLLIALDMDDAGNRGAESIIRECGHLFNVRRIKYPTNDLGDLTIEQTKEIFLPILEKI